MARKAIALSLVLMALGAATADARKHRQRMSFDFAVQVARDYWAKRSVTIPCDPTPVMLDHTQTDALEAAYGFGVDMVSWPDQCRVGVTPAAEFYRTYRPINYRWMYCQDVVHEIGHIAGLSHDYGGVMAAPPELTPWGCDHPRRFQRARAQTRDGFGRR